MVASSDGDVVQWTELWQCRAEQRIFGFLPLQFDISLVPTLAILLCHLVAAYETVGDRTAHGAASMQQCSGFSTTP